MSATKPTLATRPRVATAGRPPKVWLAWAVAFAALAAGLMVADVWAQTPPPPPPPPNPANQARLFDIVSIADGSLLAQVLNGVAMLTGRDDFFLSLVSFGLLCGLLVTVARALVTQRLELQYLLIGWMMFAAMFGPKVDVVVWDLESETFEAVDDVPIGVAAVGGVASLIGVELAQAFTTVFNVPAAAGATTPLGLGFADPLSMLVELRDPEYGGVNDGDADATIPNVDIQRTISRYMKDCVMYAVAMEGSPLSRSWESLRTAPNLLTAINVPAVTWHTVTYLSNNPNGDTRTCQAAHAELSTALTGFAAARFEFLGAKVNRPNAQAEVQAAMDYFFGLGRNAQDLMLNAVLARELEQASVDYQATAGNSARVTMLTQAVEQRRTQWAAEKTLFEEVAQPLMAYIEAFFYAVSPIMAFLFVLGPFGMKLFGRYLLLAAWIQLWIPIMALNNLYIHHGAARNIQALRDGGGADILSMVGLNSVWTEAASWIAVGGMMAAATPLLALMLLSGSYFAMTQLTNRMAGSDFTNEKIMSPDVMQPAAVATAGSLFTQEPRWVDSTMRGTHLYGAPGVAPQFDWDAEAKAREEHLQSRSVAYDNQWRQMSSVALKETMSAQEGASHALNTLTSNTAQFTQMDQATWKAAESIAEKHVDLNSYSEQERTAFTGAIGLGIQSGMPLSGLGQGIYGKLQASVEKAKIDETKSTDEILDSMSTEIATANQSSAHLSESVAGSESAARNSVFAQAIGMDRAEGFDETASGMEKNSAALSSVRGHVREMGIEQHMDIMAFGDMYQDQRGRLWSAAVQAGVSEGDVDDMAGRYQQYYGMKQPQAVTAALGTMLAIHDPGTAYSLLAGDQAGVTDGFMPATDLPEIGPLQRSPGAPKTGVGVTEDDVVERVEGGLALGDERVQGWDTMPQERYETWRQQVDEKADQAREMHLEQATSNRTQALIDQYHRNPSDNPPSMHPVLSAIHSGFAGTGVEFNPPSAESATGQRILQSYRDEAAAHNLPDDLQEHYARLAAKEQQGVQFDPSEHPSRDELEARYAHGEEIVGYVENAALTHTGSPTEYLGASSHILEHPPTD